MYKLYNLALMIFLAANAFCQDFHVSGKIMSGILVVEDATIFNARSKMQSLSNLKGEFQIDAIKGDSLIFTKSGFFTIFKVVASEAFLTIALEGSLNTLKEVKIRSSRSSPLVNYQKIVVDTKAFIRREI